MAPEKRQNGNGVDATANIDIDALEGSMKRMMMPPPRNMSSKTCIFKTPEILSRHNKKAYLPNAFSIGPLHHGQPKLAATQEIKLYYLHGLLSRAPTPETNLKDLIESVAALEEEARTYYNSRVIFSKEEFTKILLLDGCFLVELLRKNCGVVSTEEGDPVLKVPNMLQCLSHDLVLLENQIPWFVLQRLYSMTAKGRIINIADPLTKMVSIFFACKFSGEGMPTLSPSPPCGQILHLLRETLILSSSTQSDFMTGDRSLYFGALSSLPSATRLVEAGVKFRKLGHMSSNSILDIKFDSDRGVLEMSPFVIQDTTEATFRNLISFEQCYSGCKLVITSYLRLLDDLIDTSKDLNILCDKGIISNCCVDAEDATRAFNGLLNDCYVAEFYYTDLCREVNAYCKRKWPRWRAMYMRNYFGTPWAIASQVLAALLLIFAFLQTLFTIIN